MRRFTGGLIAAALSAWASAACASCQIKVYADFPLKPNPSRALVAGAINHKPTMFILGTGADISSMPYADAVKLGVTISGMNNITSEGVGGRVNTGYGHFDMEFGSAKFPKEVMLILAMHALDNNAVALIGRELLMQHDLEINLPDNDIKVLQPQGCTEPQLVYWNKPYSQTRLEGDGTSRPAILVNVLLNGRVTRALVDSGTPHSIVTPAAAKAAGASIDDAPPGGTTSGIGGGGIEVRTVRFDTFTIGDETIKNTKLIVADLWKNNKLEETGTRLGSESHDLGLPRMLLGADFLHAHRVFVANSMGLMLFSYTGGPVFDTSQERQPADQPSPPKGTQAPVR
jgi:hypothetical protein